MEAWRKLFIFYFRRPSFENDLKAGSQPLRFRLLAVIAKRKISGSTSDFGSVSDNET